MSRGQLWREVSKLKAMPTTHTGCGNIWVASSGHTPEQPEAPPRAPTREVTAALRHPEAAGPDRGPPSCPASWTCSQNWREFPFMAPGCQAGLAPSQFFFSGTLLLCKIQVLGKRRESGTAFFLKKPFSFSSVCRVQDCLSRGILTYVVVSASSLMTHQQHFSFSL